MFETAIHTLIAHDFPSPHWAVDIPSLSVDLKYLPISRIPARCQATVDAWFSSQELDHLAMAGEGCESCGTALGRSTIRQLKKIATAARPKQDFSPALNALGISRFAISPMPSARATSLIGKQYNLTSLIVHEVLSLKPMNWSTPFCTRGDSLNRASISASPIFRLTTLDSSNPIVPRML